LTGVGWSLALLLLAVEWAWAGRVMPLWDISGLGGFDRTNKAYAINDGRVEVDLSNEAVHCPTGLGHLASGRQSVQQIRLLFSTKQPGDYWLHVSWNAGGSGKEQFEVSCNGRYICKSRLMDGGQEPYQQTCQRFNVPIRVGQNAIRLLHLSGDGLRFKNLALSRSPSVPAALNPDLEYLTLEDYQAAIHEPAIMLDGFHVRLFAPKRKMVAAKVIFDYLVKAYDELYEIVGVHTDYRIVVYHFPPDGSQAWGGTSRCAIWYSFKNLDLDSDEEWKRHRVPHVCGYIEEMAHNFVHATGAQFGWEMIGWSIGTKVTQKIAGNPIHRRHVRRTRAVQARTFQRYVKGGYVFPADVPANLCDRIHAYILWRCEQKYGPTFWTDFFKEIRKEHTRLRQAARRGDRDERYRITVDCFDRLKGLDFKKTLRKCRISLTTDIKSLNPTKPAWNRRFVQ